MEMNDLRLSIGLEQEEQIQLTYTNCWPKHSGKSATSKSENSAIDPRGCSLSGIADGA